MGARRRRRIALLVVTAAGVLLAAALAAGRRALAERALVRWLGAHGIRAAPRVAAFGLGGFEIRGLTVGSSGAPDLMVGRIVVRWSPWSLLAGRAGGIDVFGARLKLGWTDGRLAAGALETLLERPDTGDTPDTGARLPPLEAVRFHDLRITLATPAGRIAARGPLEAVFDAGGTRASATFRGTTPWGPVALAA
ncbi:MAG TPA: hypothetical protein VNO26_16855, partial [Candidatus Limnocylindria bacterium]|nr:hypothetical protein [Candidatus Limnocylindria bacterium]